MFIAGVVKIKSLGFIFTDFNLNNSTKRESLEFLQFFSLKLCFILQ